MVVFALGVVVFLGFAALVVDFGAWLQERRIYQNAADAATLVGVNHLRPPITTQSESDAVLAAMNDLDRQLRLGITNLSAAAAAASSPGGFSSATSGAGYTGPDVFYVTAPPNPDCGGPGSYVGNQRALTVRIDHLSTRFFSRILFGDNPHVSACATAASTAGGYAVAVLQPPVGTQANSTNITLNLAGAGTLVNITGGEVAVNATYAAQGNPCPNPPCHVQPAQTHFTTNGNRMELGLLNPNPLPWTISPPQITDPVGNYLAPIQLSPRLTIPGWGPGPWLDGGGGKYDPLGPAIAYDGQSGPPSSTTGTAGNCTDPANGATPGLKPGNYSQINLANGQRLWLCPGIFHIVNSGTGQKSIVMANGGVLAGQGVTLAFEADAPLNSVGGSSIYLDSIAALGTQVDAPWTTGGTLHDVPIAIWIRPVPDCDPLAASPCSDSSKVFQLAGGSGIDEQGIIYGPTDNIVLSSANTTQASQSGEVWAWTLTYTGQASLNQTFAGPDVSYPTLVQ